MSIPPKPDPEKNCEACGKPMFRKRFGARLEDRGVFLRRRNCSRACANTKRAVVKDTHHWRARKHRKESCLECGTDRNLHVHHRDRNPENNDPENLETLCASCHLRLHWREDRAKRMASAKRGVITRQRSAGGSP